MSNTKISNVLTKFKNSTNHRSILIDGPWGSGKTYQVVEFLKQNQKSRIYYLSLFGKESISQINTALCELMTNNIHKIGDAIRMLSSKEITLPQSKNVREGLKYSLGQNEKTIKDNSIVIFDDLERLSKKIDYSDMLGYFNELYLSQCRIICLFSSCNLNGSRNLEFNDFKEKVFDCIYKITDVDTAIFDNMFDELQINNIETTYHMFNQNIRFASKVKLCFSTIINYIESLDDSKIKISEVKKLEVFKASICAVNKIFNNKDKTCEEWLNKIPDFNQLVSYVSNAYSKQDFIGIEEFYKPINKDITNNILDKEYFYLSDQHKEEFFQKLTEMLETDDFEWSNKLINIVASIYKYSDFNLSDDALNNIAKKIYESEKDDLDEAFETFSFDKETINRVENLVTILKSKVEVIKNQAFKEEYAQAYEKKDYLKMKKYIESLATKEEEKKNFITEMLANGFYLPDLSGDISHECWSFSHFIAKFVNSNNLSKKFKEMAKEICGQNKNNKSLVERYYALIYYNIDENFTITKLLE